MVDPVTVRCRRCGNWAVVPAVAAPTATCNNHAAHHHTRGEHMHADNEHGRTK
jgi:hypothetical protein